MFSLVIRHPVALTAQAPVIFLQYLAALAIVQGIKTYDVGFKNLPIKLKWPNDICKCPVSTKTSSNPKKMPWIHHQRLMSRLAVSLSTLTTIPASFSRSLVSV